MGSLRLVETLHPGRVRVGSVGAVLDVERPGRRVILLGVQPRVWSDEKWDGASVSWGLDSEGKKWRRLAMDRGQVKALKPQPQINVVLRSFANDATEVPSDGTRQTLDVSFSQATARPSMPVLPENRADDISLQNPLRRLERMGCGWLGVVMEWEGVVVESDVDLERNAWCALAQEEGRPQPPLFVLKRVDGMKNEQALSEVLCWTRDFRQLKRLATRKEELYEEMQGGTYRLRAGAREFLETLKKFNVPMAIASTRPRRYLDRAIEALGMEGFFSAVITAEDVCRGKPDPELFLYAAERLSFIPERCIVFGNSNSSVEASHDAGMKCVAVAGKHPVYELGAADLIVSRLDNLSVVDLKNLADLESPDLQFVPEPEVEVKRTLPLVAVRDW